MTSLIITLGHRLTSDGEPTDILDSRVKRAIGLANSIKNKSEEDVYLLFSGGVPEVYSNIQNFPTEANKMEELAVNYFKFPEENILKESNSKTTIENALYTRDKMVIFPLNIKRCYLVTSDFHMKRAARIFRRCLKDPLILVEDDTSNILDEEERNILDKKEMKYLEEEWPFDY